MNAEGFFWGVSGFAAGTEELRQSIARALLAAIAARKIQPISLPTWRSAPDNPSDRPLTLGEVRRELAECPKFHLTVEESDDSASAPQFVQEAAHEAKTGRLFVVEKLSLALVKTLSPDSNDAIGNSVPRPPFARTFILATIENLPDVCLLGAAENGFSTDMTQRPGFEFGCLYPGRLENGAIGWNAPSKDDITVFGNIISVILSLIADSRCPAKRIEVDAKLNKARIKRGKAPIPPYFLIEPPKPTVLVPDAAPARFSAAKGGTHASPRPHDRRGHPRHLKKGDRTTWVRSTRVNALIPHLTRDRSHYEIKLSPAAP